MNDVRLIEWILSVMTVLTFLTYAATSRRWAIVGPIMGLMAQAAWLVYIRLLGLSGLWLGSVIITLSHAANLYRRIRYAKSNSRMRAPQWRPVRYPRKSRRR